MATGTAEQATQHVTFHSFDGWEARRDNETLLRAWQEDQLAAAIDWRQRQGFCPACGEMHAFDYWEGADLQHVNLREHLICSNCRMNSRVRASYAVYVTAPRTKADRNIYVTEQVTPPFVWLQDHLPGRVIGSEFEPSRRKRRALMDYYHGLGGKGKVNYNDVTRLSFWSRTLDTVMSFDVLEHVPDYRRALHEFARVLRPGGHLIATFPFLDVPETLVRARVRGDGIEHLLEPEYHGDPIAGGGVLCFYHFGWDVLDDCRKAGFRDARFVMPHAPASGLLHGLWTLVATK